MNDNRLVYNNNRDQHNDPNNCSFKKQQCLNCFKFNHSKKNCREPIISLGIIAFKLDIPNIDINIFAQLIENKNMKKKFELINIINFYKFKNNIKIIMIQRKFSLGFVEFIRGKYRCENSDGILYLFKQMTPQEISLIKTKTFDELWKLMWNDNNPSIFAGEYNASKNKYTKINNSDSSYNLSYFTNIDTFYDDLEWGFPKGRRKKYEKNIDCAKREFEEETGFLSDDYYVVDNVNPIEEIFIGTNGIKYKHIYYIALLKNNVKLPNIYNNNEISNVNLFTYDEFINNIRPYYNNRMLITTYMYIYIINILCFINKTY